MLAAALGLPAALAAPAGAADSGLSPEEQIVINVYRQASPGVVHIISTTLSFDFFFNVVPQQGTGSGFFVDDKGHILTNNHVVQDAHRLEVTLSDGQKIRAKLVGRDPQNDLAVLRVALPREKLHPLRLGDSSQLQVGQMAIAIGNPFGLQRTITRGVISSLGRDLRVDPSDSRSRLMRGIIQTDAAINPGNSGGPLLNSRGEVVGLNTAIFTPSGGSVGIGFAVPINTAKRHLPQLIAKGRVAHPWLGISGQTLDAELAAELRLPVTEGILVAQVFQGSPAERGGIRGGRRRVQAANRIVIVGGDIITAIDGVKLKSVDDLTGYLDAQRQVGDTVRLDLVREGRPMALQLKLGELPDE
jgi:S1-C subfamily serine protease